MVTAVPVGVQAGLATLGAARPGRRRARLSTHKKQFSRIAEKTVENLARYTPFAREVWLSPPAESRSAFLLSIAQEAREGTTSTDGKAIVRKQKRALKKAEARGPAGVLGWRYAENAIVYAVISDWGSASPTTKRSARMFYSDEKTGRQVPIEARSSETVMAFVFNDEGGAKIQVPKTEFSERCGYRRSRTPIPTNADTLV